MCVWWNERWDYNDLHNTSGEPSRINLLNGDNWIKVVLFYATPNKSGKQFQVMQIATKHNPPPPPPVSKVKWNPGNYKSHNPFPFSELVGRGKMRCRRRACAFNVGTNPVKWNRQSTADSDRHMSKWSPSERVRRMKNCDHKSNNG